MLLVPVAFLRPGMVTARPVLHPEKDALLLLGEGYSLDQRTITQLQTNRVSHAWVNFPGLEDVSAPSREVALGHMELIRVLNQSIDRLEHRVSVQGNIQDYRKSVHQMLAEIVADPSHDPLTYQLAVCGPTLAGHLANVAYLSLLLGNHLGGYLRDQRKTLPAEDAEKTTQLGLGALLHDIGKVFMADELQHLTILDNDTAGEKYRTHVLSGYQEVRDHLPSVAAYIVLNHHQRFDGSGFPRRTSRDNPNGLALNGGGIHIFARIVGCVDLFDHLLCPQGKPRPNILALTDIRSPRFHGWFDPIVLAGLQRVVPAFNVGSVVRLTDSQYAVIISTHDNAPTRPTVRLLTGPLTDSFSRVAARQLDLRMCPNLGIAEVEGMDVRDAIQTYDRLNGHPAAA